MNREQFEQAKADLAFRDILATAMTAMKNGRVDRIAILHDGKAPMKQIAVELSSNDQIAVAEKLLRNAITAVDARLAQVGVDPS